MNRLKQITTKAKALYKTGKYAKWTDAIKAASKQTATVGATKKKTAKKKAAPKKKSSVKKAAAKKKAASRNYGSHKDTKSHNVKISVVSGTKTSIPKNKKYNLHATIQKMNGLYETLHFFYFPKLTDAKKAFTKILHELKEKKERGVYTIEILNITNLKPVKQLTWLVI